MANNKLSGEAPRVVQIETRYVETDAINFRDVVQSLTGKNSSTAWIGRKNKNAPESSVVAGSEINRGTAVTAKAEEGATNLPSMQINKVPFKDFDTLLLELPPMRMEDTHWF